MVCVCRCHAWGNSCGDGLLEGAFALHPATALHCFVLATFCLGHNGEVRLVFPKDSQMYCANAHRLWLEAQTLVERNEYMHVVWTIGWQGNKEKPTSIVCEYCHT